MEAKGYIRCIHFTHLLKIICKKNQTDVVEMTNKLHIQRMTELLAATYMYEDCVKRNHLHCGSCSCALWFATLK